MNYETFERLCVRVIQLMPHMTEDNRLLEEAVHILKASDAILFSNGADGKLPVAWSSGLRAGLAAQDLGSATDWYAGMVRSERPGYSTEEEPLLVCGERYAAGVVGFGDKHDLLVLCRAKPGQLHESYHAWALASLAKAFEASQQKELANLRKVLLDRCTREFGGLVRESSEWPEVLQIYDAAAGVDVRPSKWLYTLEYLGYRARLRWKGRDKKDKGRIVGEDAPDVDKDAADLDQDAPDFAKRVGQLLKSDSLIVDCAPALGVFDPAWLPRDPAGGPHAKAPIGESGLTYENWEEVCLLLLEHGWRLLLEKAVRVSVPAGQTGSSSGGSQQPSPRLPVEDLTRSAGCLLALGARLFGARVHLGWPREDVAKAGTPTEAVKAAHPDEFATGMAMDRVFLWTYLGVLVAQSSSLRTTYLAAGTTGTAVPEALRWDYVINLARFYLGLVERLERARRMDVTTRTVSATETLDALLYLVDRYVHVDLGVEEWVDLRQHLARSLPGEVARHLGSNRYRDHLLHVIDVFLLGHLLLHTSVPGAKSGKDEVLLVDQLRSHPHACKDRKSCGCLGGASRATCLRNWALAALLHDIGYQVSDSPNEPGRAGALLGYFDLASLDATSELAPSADSETGFLDGLVNRFRGRDPDASWLPNVSRKEIRSDHGALSGLRLGQVLAAFGAREPTCKGGPDRFVAQYFPALHAISHHSLPEQQVSLRVHPMSCLLRLCDELQEWGRHRVNIERMTKQLYLAIEGETSIELGGRQLLSQMKVNITPSLSLDPDALHFRLIEADRIARNQNRRTRGRGRKAPPLACFHFELNYQDPEKAEYDATLTLLSKAFNLQHVDVTPLGGQTGCRLRWCILLKFPRPAGYRDSSEYDIYAQFAAEKARWLPPSLPRSQNPVTGEGLIRIEAAPGSPAPSQRQPDRFAIVIDGGSSSKARKGWLVADPARVAHAFLEFKRSYLLPRSP